MNPIVQALRQLIDWLPPADLPTQFRTCSSLVNFNDLWQLNSPEKPTRQIVVADGLPVRTANDGVDVGRYLTPYDWAALHTLNAEAATPIVLVEPSGVSEPQTDGERFFASAHYRQPAMLPNICVVAPVGCGSRCGTIVDLWNHLEQATMPTVDQQAYVRRCWRAALTQSEVADDHHAIANLVGPMALWEDGPWDDHARALRQLLRGLDLFPRVAPPTEQPALDWTTSPLDSVLRTFPNPEQPIRLLLLDDMAERQHWATILRRFLGLSEADTPKTFCTNSHGITIELQACEMANRLLELLKPNADLPDVLLLDLRLFQGQSLIHEANLYREMLPIAEEYIDHDGTRTPWPGFTPNDIARMRAWLESPQRGQHADYHLILTLPARLLALRHPLLAIVLFSSASRRPMLEHVKPYGTIHTAIAKPHVPNTDGAYLIPDFVERLTHALVTALPIAAGRRVWRNLEAAVQSQTIPTPFFDQPGDYHIEFLLDEQNDKKANTLTVSGLLLLFSNSGDATALHQTFENHYQTWLTQKRGTPKEWLNKCGEQLAEMLDEYTTQKQVLTAVLSITGAMGQSLYENPLQSDEFHDARVGDNLNRQLIQSNIEMAIYGFARGHIPAGSRVTFGVYGATRWGQFDPQTAEQFAEQLWLRWGLRTQWIGSAGRVWNALDDIAGFLSDVENHSAEMERIVQHLQPALDEREQFMANPTTAKERKDLRQEVRYTEESSIRPWVQEVMQAYDGASFRPRLSFARAFNINNEKHLRADQGLMIHTFADIVMRDKEWLIPLRQRGWQEAHGWAFRSRLQALRCHLRGQQPEALAELALYPLGDSCFGVQLAHDVLQAARTMNGRELLRFCQCRQTQAAPTSTPLRLRGTIVVDATGNHTLQSADLLQIGGQSLMVPVTIDDWADGTIVEFQLVRYVIPDWWDVINIEIVSA